MQIKLSNLTINNLPSSINRYYSFRTMDMRVTQIEIYVIANFTNLAISFGSILIRNNALIYVPNQKSIEVSLNHLTLQL